MGNLSIRTVLQAGTSRTGAALSLVHRTSGLEIAGAGTRNASEAYGSLYVMRDGTRGGQWFNNEADALAHYSARNVESAQ